MTETTGSDADLSLLDRAARRRLTPRQEAVNDELRRLLGAGLDLLRRNTAALPRVSDVVAAAHSSNDAFYRAFGSREAFLAVVVDDGLRRLLREVERRVGAAGDHAERLAAALDTVLDQARDSDAATTMKALLAGAPRHVTGGIGLGGLADRLADRLAPELEALCSPDPRRDALTVARAALGVMEQHLTAGTVPGSEELSYLTGLVARMTGRTAARGRPTAAASSAAAAADAVAQAGAADAACASGGADAPTARPARPRPTPRR